jgi:hypothetical protein
MHNPGFKPAALTEPAKKQSEPWASAHGPLGGRYAAMNGSADVQVRAKVVLT